MRSSSMLDFSDAKIYIFCMCHMKGHKSSITFHQKNMAPELLRFHVEKGHQNSYFLHYDI